MKDLQALELVIGFQRRHRDELAGHLARISRDRAVAAEQLSQLERYAQETDNAWNVRGAVHSAGQLQHHQSFARKLHLAIAFQHDVLANHDRQIAANSDRVAAASKHVAALESLIAERRKEIAARQKASEQRMTDELASQQFVRRQVTTPINTRSE